MYVLLMTVMLREQHSKTPGQTQYFFSAYSTTCNAGGPGYGIPSMA